MNELHNFTLLFLAMLAVSTIMRLYLSQRQISYVSSHRAQVPESFADKISLEDHQKAADYTTTTVNFGRLPLFYEVALILVWTLGGGLQWLNQNIVALDISPIFTGIIVILAFTLISSLLDLPFSIYRRYKQLAPSKSIISGVR